MKSPIKTFAGTTVGFIDTDSQGNKTVTTYAGTIIGYYKADRNCTTNFAGTILFWGDMSGALLLKYVPALKKMYIDDSFIL